jgi:hypothetical protein
MEVTDAVGYACPDWEWRKGRVLRNWRPDSCQNAWNPQDYPDCRTKGVKLGYSFLHFGGTGFTAKGVTAGLFVLAIGH